MRRVISVGILVAAVLCSCLPWESAAAAVHHSTSSWSRHDCAVYVVSTMNLLHFRNGRPITSALVQKMAVTHYDVYADQQVSDLYFIEPMTDGGSSVGALAYQVVQRSDAWGRLLADCFPTALRLSIHPQPPHSEKIGILLGDADDVWITPWHGVAVWWAGRWRLMKRSDAEELGARLVERDGGPSHFEVSS